MHRLRVVQQTRLWNQWQARVRQRSERRRRLANTHRLVKQAQEQRLLKQMLGTWKSNHHVATLQRAESSVAQLRQEWTLRRTLQHWRDSASMLIQSRRANGFRVKSLLRVSLRSMRLAVHDGIVYVRN